MDHLQVVNKEQSIVKTTETGRHRGNTEIGITSFKFPLPLNPGLVSIQLKIPSLLFYQLFMPAAFGNLSIFNH